MGKATYLGHRGDNLTEPFFGGKGCLIPFNPKRTSSSATPLTPGTPPDPMLPAMNDLEESLQKQLAEANGGTVPSASAAPKPDEPD